MLKPNLPILSPGCPASAFAYRNPFKHILAGSFAAVIAAATVSFAHADSVSPASLVQHYNERIATIALEVRAESVHRTAILGQLDDTLNRLDSLTQEQNRTRASGPELHLNLQKIDQQIAHIDQQIKINQMLLAEVNHALRQQPPVSIWQAALGQADTLQHLKQRSTQRYLQHSSKKTALALKHQQQQLRQQHASLQDVEQGLDGSLEQLDSERTQLLEHRVQLEERLAKISNKIVKKQDRADRLEARASTLKANPDAMLFTKLQKQLPDPIDGLLLKRFAEPKAKGLLKWKGILVSAPLGVPFTAVTDGLVVFANHIQGLGNVAIIDHGQGYMSLYGHAELLLVEPDQLLLAGDPVGTVGESPSTGKPALYFEIRHNADTLDPQNWLKMNQISQKKEL